MTARIPRWTAILALTFVVAGAPEALAKKGQGGGGGSLTNPAFAFVTRDNSYKRQTTYDEVHLMTSSGSAELSLGVGKGWAQGVAAGTRVTLGGISWSPDLDNASGYQGALAYVLNLGYNAVGNGLYAIDVEIAVDGTVTIGSETFITAMGSEPAAPVAWSPDGALVAYVNGRRILAVDPATGAVQTLLDTTGQGIQEQPGGFIDDDALSWSPDQDPATSGYQGQLAYSRPSGKTIALLPVEIDTSGTATTGQRTVLSCLGQSPHWAPDGSVILVEWWNDHDDGFSEGDWLAIDPVADTCTGIPGLVAITGRVNLSPDGQHYVWGTGGELYRMAVGTTAQVNLTDGTRRDENRAVWCPAWSNDLD